MALLPGIAADLGETIEMLRYTVRSFAPRLSTSMAESLGKVVGAKDAVQLIRDGYTVATSDLVGIGLVEIAL